MEEIDNINNDILKLKTSNLLSYYKNNEVFDLILSEKVINTVEEQHNLIIRDKLRNIRLKERENIID